MDEDPLRRAYQRLHHDERNTQRARGTGFGDADLSGAKHDGTRTGNAKKDTATVGAWW